MSQQMKVHRAIRIVIGTHTRDTRSTRSCSGNAGRRGSHMSTAQRANSTRVMITPVTSK